MAPAARRVVANNRKAFHDYHIDERFEAGIMLAGTEVKSLREGRSNLQDSYAGESEGEMYLFNAYIPEYRGGNRFNHETKRPRKLLMRRREIGKLLGQLRSKGMTLIPLSIYFTPRGMAKVELALARGKRDYDKRQSKKEQDWNREKQRLMRHAVREG